MRLVKIQKVLEEKPIPFRYTEEDGCGSIDFEYRGVGYHIWEFCENGNYGVETNLFNLGKSEDVEGDYESILIAELVKSFT